MTAIIDRRPASDRRTGAPQTFVDVLDLRAAEPELDAMTFLGDADARDAYTNERLDLRVRQVAAQLAETLAPGARAVLLYPPGGEFLVALLACMRAGVVAVPAYPPDPSRLQRTLPRLLAIVADADADALLTIGSLRDPMAQVLHESGTVHRVRVLATDVDGDAVPLGWRGAGVSPDALAILQYTSGSTATPRGVQLTHANLLANSEAIRRTFGESRDSRGVSWLPTYHDMGLIGSLLQPLYVSCPNLMLSPISFLRRPLRWLQAISDFRATTSGGPNFAYGLAVRRTTPEERAQLELSCWETAFNGAEPVRPETLDAFVDAFAPCGFRRSAFLPCYGLAESTLIVTGRPPAVPRVVHVHRHALTEGRVRLVAADHPAARALVSCGPPVPGADVVIADGDRPALPLRVGEILATGPSVATGYWRRPAGNAGVFGATLADAGERRFLRTGDAGFLLDGELYVTGRLKDLIIVRGRNYDPTELEAACEAAAPEVRRNCGTAFGVPPAGDASDEPQVVVVYELTDEAGRPHDEIVKAMRRAVAREIGLQLHGVALVKPRTIPKTSSGKLQRGACRAQYVGGELELVTHWTLPTTTRRT
jgi:acyl-CoA synthetase (AMP-forming)/AMP-acid ligase II